MKEWGWIHALGAFCLGFLVCLHFIADPWVQPLGYYIHRYQALIAGFFAIFASIIGVAYLRSQTRQAKEHFSVAVQAESIASAAMLPGDMELVLRKTLSILKWQDNFINNEAHRGRTSSEYMIGFSEISNIIHSRIMSIAKDDREQVLRSNLLELLLDVRQIQHLWAEFVVRFNERNGRGERLLAFNNLDRHFLAHRSCAVLVRAIRIRDYTLCRDADFKLYCYAKLDSRINAEDCRCMLLDCDLSESLLLLNPFRQ